MKGKISFLEQVTASSGAKYCKISLEGTEFEGRRSIVFVKSFDEVAVGQEISFNQKVNPDGSYVYTLDKPFSGGFKAQAIDYKLEAMKMAIELIKSDKIEMKQLEASTQKLYKILNAL